jgi:hypothetical protein
VALYPGVICLHPKLADFNFTQRVSTNAFYYTKAPTPEAAAYLGLSPSTLEKLRLYGGGPVYYKSSPKIVLYETPDLDDWLHARRCTNTGDNDGLARFPHQREARAE